MNSKNSHIQGEFPNLGSVMSSYGRMPTQSLIDHEYTISLISRIKIVSKIHRNFVKQICPVISEKFFIFVPASSAMFRLLITFRFIRVFTVLLFLDCLVGAPVGNHKAVYYYPYYKQVKVRNTS